MNEIVSIIYQFLIMVVIFSAPLNLITDKNFYKFEILNRNNFYLKLSINIFFHLNFFLIFSFLEIDLKQILFFLIFFSIILNTYYLYGAKIKYNYSFIIYSLIVLAIFFKIAAEPKLEWDGLNHWIAKALIFFNGTNISDIKNHGMAEYPHLGPYIWSFFWKNSLLQYEYLGRLFYAFFYVTCIFCFI